ncbi:MAG: helix-turn-helix transcriptional regulator [Pegethrix bostrychoides GSE-TBD4-15B]|jgi:transcriptional regulator with XRE-family HTH domain|uniref:Helix-turn-helix transcriptional regulator n=1 Tax=Pegethrix bostrychoides GSE-TBD4-15B TaxID=2839662 RepID=A0A951PD70_9CYAN|nr:helix-turn-helix transcriptional regulator [Pegethrix bostrychoides GSE-TBD4-15B]
MPAQLDYAQPDYSDSLRGIMQPLGISSFRALAQAAGLSRWQVDQLRRGQVRQLRLEVVIKLAQTLQVSLEQLLELSESSRISATPSATAAQLRQEYQRLQIQLDQQRQLLQQEFQQTSLQALESWLTYYPAAAQKAAADPNWPAVKLLPLIRPIEALLKTWNVEMLAPVGAVLPYDPQQHLLIVGSADPGDAVTVRHPGYRHGERLLYRAKVSRVE